MATAVTFRHGTYDQTRNWSDGALAEITVDTTNQTLWVHDGDGTGTELAKADLTNIDPTILVMPNEWNITLLKTDLSNFRNGSYTNIDEHGQNKQLGTAIAYYLDLPTNESIVADGFAKADMSNVSTTEFSDANGHATGARLAKADLSNINSGGESVIQNKIDTSLNGYATQTYVTNQLNNYVTTSTLNDYKSEVNTTFNNYQLLSEKSTNISSQNDDIHYPTNAAVSTYTTTQLNNYQNKNQKSTSLLDNLDNDYYPTNLAVYNYVQNKVSSNYATTKLDNITEWDTATSNSNLYKYYVSITNGGSGYVAGDVGTLINSDITYIDESLVTHYLQIKILSVSDGKVTAASIEPDIADTEIASAHSFTDPAKGAVFSMTSTLYGVGGNLVTKDAADTYYAPLSHSNNSTIHVTQANKNTWDGKQNAITNSAKLSSDLVDDTNHTNKFVTASDKTNWNNKVDKVSTASQVYATDASGNQTTLTYASDNTASTVVMRNASSQITVATTPTANGHATSKKYVDDALALKANTSSLATVATSGSYTDLINTPTIPAAQVQSNWTQTTTTAVDYIKNKPNLAAVATSGSYSDLINKPTIPAAQIQSDWTQTTTTAVDYIKNKPNLAAVATSGAYNDLSGKPTIPIIDQTYGSTSTNAQSGVAIESQKFVRGASDSNSQSAPTHIAVYATDALALAASQSHPTWVCFSLGQ